MLTIGPGWRRKQAAGAKNRGSDREGPSGAPQGEGETMTRRQLGWAAAVCVGMALPTAALGGEDPWWVVPPRKAERVGVPGPGRFAGPADPSAFARTPRAPAGAGLEPPGGSRLADVGWNALTRFPVRRRAGTRRRPARRPWRRPCAGGVAGRLRSGAGRLAGAAGGARAAARPRAPPGRWAGLPPMPPAPDGGYNTGVAVDQPLHHLFLEGCIASGSTSVPGPAISAAATCARATASAATA